jgi:hypothetical protein
MKKIFLSAFLILSVSICFSQRFINGVGVCAFSTGGIGYPSFATFGFTYSPRVNVYENDNSSVSIGIPLSLTVGYTPDGDSYSSVRAAFNIPLVVNYNFGCGSTRHNESRVGFFAGGGFGYHSAAYESVDTYGDDGTVEIESYGPVGNIGVRFGIGRRSKNIEIKASYMKGLDVTKSDIGGLAAIFNF